MFDFPLIKIIALFIIPHVKDTNVRMGKVMFKIILFIWIHLNLWPCIFQVQTDHLIKKKYIMAASVADYYNGKTVFITGATGFLGKALLEKLLRACPEIKIIYCLVRPKKGEPGYKRLEKVFEDPVSRK